MILLASAGGNTVPVIARLLAADEDTVRDVIHRFERDRPGLSRWAGGHPRLLSDDDEAFVIQPATTRAVKLGQPFTRWSIRKLTAYRPACPLMNWSRLIRPPRTASIHRS
ncbi:helix-turn-helix domain-containing protein [Streptomyces sp. NPDC005784]|uniref:helix-turn-helix domain-containing protein n=1 Tax=Streptomyces sp. NPDC005784 TaxID=3364731 RepID=UPI0036B3E915